MALVHRMSRHDLKPVLPRERLLELMALSREADKREAILFRQGRAKFQLPGAGHEAMAALAFALEKDDIVYPYYRDKALMLARGTSLEQLALDYFAKESSTSGGRQMASHFCDRDANMMSCGTPTGMQCLPAAGTAWSIRLSGKKQVVVCCIGEASTRQGEFYEALCFAFQEKLPIVFVVEDNAYGISTATKNMTPYALDALSKSRTRFVDGRDPEAVFSEAVEAVDDARHSSCPSVLWVELDRLMSHTSSDDHRIYRPKAELDMIERRDPLTLWAQRLQSEGIVSEEQWETKHEELRERVCEIYEAAEQAQAPDISNVTQHIFSGARLKPQASPLPAEHDKSMAEAVNLTLRHLLAHHEKVILFGEDIADPKGGVFGLTKGLSTHFPGRVFNSPLAEATICGVAAGLSLTGDHVPVFELQFIDFIGTAFNQLVNQIATLRWRTMGRYACPMVILAPCGAYLGCGGPWHSQTNEAWLAHAPGLKVAMPSSPGDAAEIICAAAYGEDPTIVLLPKNQFFKRRMRMEPPTLHPEQPRIRRKGNDVTIAAWGNCCEIALDAAEHVNEFGLNAEVIDLRYLAPLDVSAVSASVARTGRLLVVQEDARTCSLGQAVIAECMARPEVWKALKAPPQLISRGDVHIGYHPDLENAVLPHVEDVVNGLRRMAQPS